ncbi:MAG: class I mannose-6-phosphate isomerase [Coriobacteriaceae bacterium]|nr:class I mannose-6-phosphate isomerase [Coriobacteriaceae bacterium]
MAATNELIRLEPVFHEMIWGGRRLADTFGYEIPDGPIGECWAISAHPHGDCRVTGGRFDGMLLSELWEEHRDEVFPGATGDRFPLLIKIIDAASDLSIQVHPDDAYAAEHENGSLGKRECWYILDCDEGATIIVGQNARSREEFAQMVEEGRWSELLHEVPIRRGDFFQIDAGTVHAIKGGTLILEVQQSSDITYRVYDYDRPGKDGKPRELHLAQSLDVIDYGAAAPASGAVSAPEVDGVTVLEANGIYTVERVRVDGAAVLANENPFLCLSVIDGSGTVAGQTVAKGAHLIVPAVLREVELAGEMELIASHV